MKRLFLLSSTLLCACAMQRSAPQAPTATPARAISEEPASSASSAPAPDAAAPVGAEADKAGAPAAAPAKKPAAASGAGAAGGMVVLPNELASAQAQLEQASKAFTAAGNDCPSLCKSLGSMSNATEHLCGLVEGTTDQQRCIDARARLAAAQAKVQSTCGATCG